jgi:6-phosphogluconolactonase (cycloisomerase 2 family)
MSTGSHTRSTVKLTLIAALVAATTLAGPASARAAFLDFVEVQREGIAGVDGLAGVLSVLVSPDGQNVYAAGPSDNAVAVFRRDAATGALTLMEVQKDGVDGVDGLAFASALALSPDGAHLYVTGSHDGAVAVFRRDTTTGALSFVEAQENGVAGVEGLAFARAVAVSPDGSHVYVAGQQDNAVAVFRRNALTGWLTFVEVQRQGVRGVDGIAGPLALMVSPDGAHVYVAAGSQSAVTVFSRNASTGGLTLVAVEGEGAIDLGLSGIHSVAVSPDGAYVYAAGQADSAVGIFRRNKRTGALTFTDIVAQGFDGVDGLYGALWVTLSPNGAQVYVASTHDNALAVFTRDAGTGALTFVEKQEGAPDRPWSAFARGAAVSPDGKSVYVAGASSNAVAVFRVVE